MTNPSREKVVKVIHNWTALETELFQLARPYLSVMNNEMHTKEVVRFAFKLLDAVGGDRDIVIPAAILHDVGWSQLTDEQALKARRPDGDRDLLKMHEKKGVEIAKKILEQALYDAIRTEEILAIIEGHDSRKHALTLNDEIVKDADKLSRCSKTFFIMVMSKPFPGGDAHTMYEKFERDLGKWFFLPISKEIAKKELKARRKEIGDTSEASPN